jgi:hypothetical protein
MYVLYVKHEVGFDTVIRLTTAIPRVKIEKTGHDGSDMFSVIVTAKSH